MEKHETGVKMTKEKIPAQYNTNTELMAMVKENEPNAFDFPLKLK